MDEDMRDSVREFYGAASKGPVAGLCCPVSYDDKDVAHIPKEALDIAYGCGSPVALADMKEGETVVDLGSGGGIDCFIAAKKGGKDGKGLWDRYDGRDAHQGERGFRQGLLKSRL